MSFRAEIPRTPAASFHAPVRLRLAELASANCPFRNHVDANESHFGPGRQRGLPDPTAEPGERRTSSAFSNAATAPTERSQKLFEINAPIHHPGSRPDHVGEMTRGFPHRNGLIRGRSLASARLI